MADGRSKWVWAAAKACSIAVLGVGIFATVQNEMDIRARRTTHACYGFYEKHAKRPLDALLASAALLCLSPVMALIGVLVRYRLGPPVLFAQARPGRDEKLFTLYKFRTMADLADADGAPLPDAERLTPFGAVLRSTSLDELPELVNIIKGDMSFVGPRPLIPQYLPYYTKQERRRHDVRPGLTGPAQAGGRNALSWEERFALDCGYVGRITLRTDIGILVKTAAEVFRREGVVTRGTEGSVPDFDVYRRQEEEAYGTEGSGRYATRDGKKGQRAV